MRACARIAAAAAATGKVENFRRDVSGDTRASTLARIQAMEERLPQVIAEHADARLGSAMAQAENNIAQHVRDFAASTQQKRNEAASKHGEAIGGMASSKSGGWKLAFLAVFGIFGAMLYSFWKWWQKEKKLHCI